MSIKPDSSVNSEYPVVDKEEFNTKVQNYYKTHSVNSKKLEWTRDRIEDVIKLLEDYNKAKFRGIRATNKQYHHAHKYDVIKTGNHKVLILKRKDTSHPTLEMIPTEDYYQKILEAHLATGHGRRDKIVNALRTKYMIPIFAIKIFLDLCRVCMTHKNNFRYNFKSTPIPIKPISSNDFNLSGQINILDFQTNPDKDYKWLLHYQDQTTKFSFLRPLKSKDVKEVALEVLKIFLQTGCPNILQSSDGIKFTTSVLSEITRLWSACDVIQGQIIDPQTESIEKTKQDIKNMIQAWMVDNNAKNWSFGCYFVQFQMNSSYQLSTHNTPYKAVFGTDPRLGVTSLSENMVTHFSVEVKVEKGSEDSENNEEKD